MTISFNTIPSNTLVPIFYAEMDNQAANTAQDSGASLLIGHANNGAEIVANSLVLMPSADYALQICGAGSQLARMVEAYRQTDPFGELYVIAVPEATGAAATVTLTVTGAATETGTVNVYVGRTRVQAPVTNGDNVTTIASSIQDAINAVPALPFTASSSAGVVTLTARHKGLCGNEIPVSLNYYGFGGGEVLPAGVQIAVAGLALGGGLAAGLTLSLKSYADQENAATGLKVAMMDANGEVGKSFQDINKLAIGLGNQLPGTTADFQNMMQMLVRQGIPAENILGGVGKATAYLAVQLKKTPEAAAEFAAKMQDATGTASEDMMGLFDTIQKAFYLGVDDTNMLSFFTKTSSVLKMVNKDGLQAAQSLAPISVMMDQMGMNGESAGNALRKVIQSGLSVKKIRDVNKIMARQKLGVQLDFTDGKGSFGGLDNMFRQLAKLRKLTDVKRTGVLKAIFGDDAETLQVVNALIDKGKDGYDQIQQKMNKQASLNKRVQAQLGTLSNLWEAMTGTATNGLAAIGGAFSGDAKNITQWLGELGEKFTKFADENPRVIRGVVGLAAGLAILKLGLMGVGSAISIVSRIMSMTPIGMIATAIALAAGLIITNWDVVGPYFKKLWETIGPYFEAGWELLKKVFAWSPLGMVINNWGPVVKWFQDMWDKLKPIIEWFTDSSGDTVDAINSAQWGAGAYDAYGTGIPARGYTPYPAVDLAQSNNASDATGPNPFMINKASAPKVDGEIKVSFINMPPGMRVTETRSSGIDINHDVGYTRFW
ncbi:TPA: phage tail tape measure protein [Escherichia coli]|nr:phage tail tape measure protein [Escherichia coli]